MAGQRRAHASVATARAGIRAGGRFGHPRPHRFADRFAAVGTLFERDQHPPHAARRLARSGRFRRRRPTGQARSRAPSGGRAQLAAVATARTGAGCGDDREFRGRSFRLRAVADRARAGRGGAGLCGRTSFQRAELCGELPVDAGAARTGLPAHGRRQRDHRQGSEKFRAQCVFDRPLSRPFAIDLPRQPRRRIASRGLGRTVHDDWHHRLLRRVRVHRLAHGDRRLHHRRPDVPVDLVPASAQPAREPVLRIFERRRAGVVSRRSFLVLRNRARNPVAGKAPAVPESDPRRIHVRERRLPLRRSASAGRCATSASPWARAR